MCLKDGVYVCDEDGDAEAGEEAGGTDLKRRTPHNFVRKNLPHYLDKGMKCILQELEQDGFHQE